MKLVLYLLFFLSGISGLIYQVIWVREFGNVFGNTIYSTSIVLAIFMLGLGAGSYIVGIWADRRYQVAPETLLRAYGYIELVIALLGLAITMALPSLGALSASLSAYATDAAGWNVLSIGSYMARGLIALALIAPITLLMGGTLTLLIRHLVRTDLTTSGSTIALLYGVNTVGAAAGAFLTDFVLVPWSGLQITQFIAVALNVIAGLGALGLARAWSTPAPADATARAARPARVRKAHAAAPAAAPESVPTRAILWTGLAVGLAGFAAMGMEILWLRHFNMLLGGYRAVFSLLLTVVLLGIGVGSLIGGWVARYTSRPAMALMLVQALFVVSSLVGIRLTDVASVAEAGQALEASLPTLSGWQRLMADFWFNVRPMLHEIVLPALLMGCSFPLANAVIQRTERAVGRRAGALYLANTVGAVCGSLVAGYVLLPVLGIQGTAAVLAGAAGISMVPLYLASAGITGPFSAGQRLVAGAAGLATVAAMIAWALLPAQFVVQRSLSEEMPGETVVALSEGVTEVIAVTEAPGRGRGLITNGHPMSSTAPLDQRYMRALAHVPLLAMPNPERVLVIGFGVGNSTQAATLHPSVQQVDVADLSRHVLEHASYFEAANQGVLNDPKVNVFVNDGRQHLLMQPEQSYDLVTLEPPPISYAGVASLYSTEFYSLARTRLKPGGYLTQWLPAYQVPPATGLAMIKAFIDVFPQAVLLSGTQAELLLVGTTSPRIEIDPVQITERLRLATAVRADLERLDLGTATEIVGSFIGSADTLTRATAGLAPVTDDRPLQEYGVRSAVGAGRMGVPASIFDLASVGAWCPKCFRTDGLAPEVSGLQTYMALLNESYNAPIEEVVAAAEARGEGRRLFGSAYLGAVVPDSAEVHNIVGVALVQFGDLPGAMNEFREALRRDPGLPTALTNLSDAYEAAGRPDEAITYLREAIQTNPSNASAQYELGSRLLARKQFAEAADRFRAAIEATPDFAAAHNNLGIASAEMGALDEAIGHFRQAIALDAEFEEARRNLDAALAARF